jgi:hypothetical protein
MQDAFFNADRASHQPASKTAEIDGARHRLHGVGVQLLHKYHVYRQ